MRALLGFILLLSLAALACAVFGRELPAATPTTFATPTLAATATPDAFATATFAAATIQAGDVAATAAGPEATVPLASPAAATPAPAGNGGQDGPAAACPAGGANLLANPSFEGDYQPYGAFVELNHAPDWFPWWKDGENNLRPEFKPAEASLAANRVRSGSRAQQYFKSFGQFKAGMYQTVLDVPAGRRLQLSAFGQAWSCEESSQCPAGTSFNPANMLMRVGIDPAGGQDAFSPNVVWSAYFNPLDRWDIACVEAAAAGDRVTVFLWASPDGPRQNQDIYWDDAALVALP